MKITYTQHVPDPALRGTTTNLPAHIAQVLIASGQAVAVPIPVRGSKGNGWLEARLEQSRLAGPPDVDDVVPSAPNGIEWGIKQAEKRVLVLKRIDGQLFFLDSPPADCPPTVVQQFLGACAANPEANATALAAAKKAQQQVEEKDKTAKWGVLFPTKLK